MSKELERLNLHRQIILGKLAHPNVGLARPSLQTHLRRVEGQIETILHPERQEEERHDERTADLLRRIHFNQRNHRTGNRELRARLREVEEDYDDPEAAKRRHEISVMAREAVQQGTQQQLIDRTLPQVRAILDKYRVTA